VEVIPAIDLRGGRLVRLEQGDYGRETVYADDAARVVRGFVEQGARRIHVVDLDAARDGGAANDRVVREILRAAESARVQVGGGVRSVERAAELLGLGAARVIMGTAALERPEVVRAAAERFPDRVVLGLDARNGRVAVRGWLEDSDLTCEDVLARFGDLPLAAVLHTDIHRDGTLGGPNLGATVALARSSRLPVIASGGVGALDDLLALARTRVIAGAVVGKALYAGRLDLAEALREVARC
jgi:phosphoribosylformimino-5-aminoimidazole carboxamide ribotide isomerase